MVHIVASASVWLHRGMGGRGAVLATCVCTHRALVGGWGWANARRSTI
jgi:hypothetical protein